MKPCRVESHCAIRSFVIVLADYDITLDGGAAADLCEDLAAGHVVDGSGHDGRNVRSGCSHSEHVDEHGSV